MLSPAPGRLTAADADLRRRWAALVDRSLEIAGHRGDEIARVSDLEGTPQFSVGRLRPAEPQVARDGAAEQERRLRYKSDRAAQLFLP